ncbi:hypothetical protein SEA_FIREMAN_41 [Microbacterium phage Fireman]|uniref:Uncharacterized protein n=2 Tax=Metamorphoovirus TaxID=2733195 RepID=A0A481VVW6_9CAUD|nr:hypothetical protein HOV22_gp41 [Microbacterium phage Fireman]YP_010751784.1 hypothetical protein QDA09_gp39 [Microbacterium phage Tyrumbra]QBI98124.1 hypothetical protein SEA_FIREMAN_41 [Microbacterium phage Fireman]QDP43576.1 hypothetical protein SEA_TYRUMBRA_39 [Microbacterium phage Tyrumbra]
MTDTTSQHIAARDDLDLQHRLIAAAEQMGISNASSTIASNLGTLISRTITVNGEETTLTKVHAYADGVRRNLLASEAAMPPGLNPGAVTDEHLRAAILAVTGSSNTPQPGTGESEE